MRAGHGGNDDFVGRIRQSVVRGEQVPVVSFGLAPGLAPVATRRLPIPSPPLHGSHAHDFLVLFYARRAAGTVVIDGRRWTVADGDLFVLAPGQVISFAATDQFVTDGWVVWFPADAVRSGVYSSWRTHPLLFPFARGADRAQRFRVPDSFDERFAALDAELQARRDGYREAALAHLTLLLVAVARLSTDVAGQLRSADEPLLAAVFDVIEQRYHEPISLSDVAAELALTPGHLTTFVRRRTGRTVQQWLAQRRMQEARALLTETDLTVAAISRRVGYPDTSYFIRRFRTDHEMTPAQWRAAAASRP
jgi:AraC family transcriptional activator of pobA